MLSPFLEEMKTNRVWKDILISLAVTLAVWVLFSWPLPKYAGHAIPCSAYNVEKGNMRMMMPGDNLQLLYQFWLAGDTFKGKTPLFCDPYEFNTGNDRDNTFFSTYYLPFSLFFTLGEVAGGHAVGYNFCQFLSLFLAYLFTLKLIRRFVKDDWISATAALLSIIFPYRWITMLDGSPTGLAMMWVPVIFWALDVMVSEKKMWAGALAGLGLYVSEWGDTHVFFFSVLSAPFWCLFCYIFREGARWPSRQVVVSTLKASVFLVIFLGLIVFQGWRIQHQIKGIAATDSPRQVRNVANYSLNPSGLVKFHNPGDSRKIYLGYYLILFLAAGLGAHALARCRGDDGGNLCAPLPLVLMSLAVTGIVMLSVGINNPGGFRAWKILVKLIPPYANIRQADKIFCLMPVVLPFICALLLPGILNFVREGSRRLFALALFVPLLLDYSYRIDPTICGLDRGQGAYRAVAEDAKASGNSRPHIIVLPIWPGDSHYNSVNEYYISLYHIRMINGYGGMAKKKYMDEIFLPLESMNIGGVYDSQLDSLLKRGVGYIILHEDTFPEKVSPFPVGYTLQKLLNHPRLEKIGRDGVAWAFKIRPASAFLQKAEKNFLTHLFASRRQEFEWNIVTNAIQRLNDPTAMDGGYAELTVKNGCVQIPPTMAALDDKLTWLICARGTGNVGVATVIDGAADSPVIMNVASAEWTWQRVPIPRKAASVVLEAKLSLTDGAVDLDSSILGTDSWQGPSAGETLKLPAACFFHAGYTSADFGSVVFRRDYEPQGLVFYGPKLPLEKGAYSVEFIFQSDAPSGTKLGRFNIRWNGSEDRDWTPVVAGSRAVAVFEQKGNWPFLAAFDFSREADMKIMYVLVSRLK